MGDWTVERKEEPACSPSPPSSVLGYLFGSGCVSSDNRGPALLAEALTTPPSPCILCALWVVLAASCCGYALSCFSSSCWASKLFCLCEHFPAVNSLHADGLPWLFP